MISRPLAALRNREHLGQRPPGYADTCLRFGRLRGDNVEFSALAWLRLRFKYRHSQSWKLGDWVYWTLHPFVLVLDKTFGTRWQDCQTCAERRRRLNRWWHAATRWLRMRLNGLRKPRS